MIENKTGAPIRMQVRLEAPFYLLQAKERILSKHLELEHAQCEEFVVEFDASVAEESCMDVTGLMILDYQDHPHSVSPLETFILFTQHFLL